MTISDVLANDASAASGYECNGKKNPSDFEREMLTSFNAKKVPCLKRRFEEFLQCQNQAAKMKDEEEKRQLKMKGRAVSKSDLIATRTSPRLRRIRNVTP